MFEKYKILCNIFVQDTEIKTPQFVMALKLLITTRKIIYQKFSAGTTTAAFSRMTQFSGKLVLQKLGHRNSAQIKRLNVIIITTNTDELSF